MKTIKTLAISLLFITILAACEENETLPGYKKVGTGTSTVASISVSNDEPTPGETISVTMTYVNPPYDPVKTVSLQVQIGSGAFVEFESFDDSGAETGGEITHVVDYEVPASGTVTFDMMIASQKEFPMVKRIKVTVED